MSIILRMADVAVVMSEVETQKLLLVVQGCKGREGVGTRCVPGGASSVAEPLVNLGERASRHPTKGRTPTQLLP